LNLTRVPLSGCRPQQITMELIMASSELKVEGKLIVVGPDAFDFEWPSPTIVELLGWLVSRHVPHVQKHEVSNTVRRCGGPLGVGEGLHLKLRDNEVGVELLEYARHPLSEGCAVEVGLADGLGSLRSESAWWAKAHTRVKPVVGKKRRHASGS
jgi:hypothetical protein